MPERIALAQLAPAWGDRARTVAIAADAVTEAARNGAQLVCFGESFAPGYPCWLDRGDGARFENDELKDAHAFFADQCVTIEAGHLDPLRDAAESSGLGVIIGITERPADRGGHSLYASRVAIGPDGEVLSVHRKLVPTYEERLVWGVGDGHGLRTHELAGLRVGALNCWESWIPTARAALHAQGVDLHVAIWPGSTRLTTDSTRFFAYEGRMYCASASSLLRARDLPASMPMRSRIIQDAEETIQNGGSAVAKPDGTWLVEPVAETEGLIYVAIDAHEVRRARQSFDHSGHYGRPEILKLTVDRSRHGVSFTGGAAQAE